MCCCCCLVSSYIIYRRSFRDPRSDTLYCNNQVIYNVMLRRWRPSRKVVMTSSLHQWRHRDTRMWLDAGGDLPLRVFEFVTSKWHHFSLLLLFLDSSYDGIMSHCRHISNLSCRKPTITNDVPLELRSNTLLNISYLMIAASVIMLLFGGIL